MNTTHRICFVAGTSGGHIVPCVTIAHEYKKINPAMEILFFTRNSSFDKAMMSDKSLINYLISLPLITSKRSKWYDAMIIGYHFICSFMIAFKALRHYKPEKIVTTGSFIALPVCFAGAVLRIPIELIELNVVPGAAIKMLAPLATKISLCFKKTASFFNNYKTVQIDYPHRFTLLSPVSKQMSYATDEVTILVLGGSQGSLFINNLMEIIIEKNYLKSLRLKIVHQTGSDVETQRLKKVYEKHNIDAELFSYCSDIGAFYEKASIVISRAGAGTIFESLYFNICSILIPLETNDNNHQWYNAQEMVLEHPRNFFLLSQRKLEVTPQLLAYKIIDIIALQQQLYQLINKDYEHVKN